MGTEGITIAEDPLPDRFRQAMYDANPANRVHFTDRLGDPVSMSVADYNHMMRTRARMPRLASSGRLCNPYNMSDLKAAEKEEAKRQQREKVEALDAAQQERNRPWYEKLARGAARAAKSVGNAIAQGARAAHAVYVQAASWVQGHIDGADSALFRER